MIKPDRFALFILGVIIAVICILTCATLSWKGRLALVLLTAATLFVWIEPEATGAAVVRVRVAATRWLKSMR
jgi:hypothetical protein